MKRLIWISYDLGVQGDYEGLYTWLDAHDAKECGDSLASLEYEYSDSLITDLTADLKNALELAKHTRLYVIYRDERDVMRGKFIAGGRKATPWAGYAQRLASEDVEQPHAS